MKHPYSTSTHYTTTHGAVLLGGLPDGLGTLKRERHSSQAAHIYTRKRGGAESQCAPSARSRAASSRPVRVKDHNKTGGKVTEVKVTVQGEGGGSRVTVRTRNTFFVYALCRMDRVFTKIF